MTQSFERAKSRLDNIETIEPLLGALRTISMGAWQKALNDMEKIKQYEENFSHILSIILPKIKSPQIRKPKRIAKNPELADNIILIIGTERGLCGKFNEKLAENALAWIREQNFSSYQIWAVGSRMVRILERMDVDISWRNPVPAGELSTYHQSYLTTQKWLDQFESYAFNNFVIIFNQVAKGTHFKFSAFNLLPYEVHHPLSAAGKIEEKWPPPIIETDPKGIYHQIIQHFIASSFLQVLLKSAAAEHSARFNLMQEAEENADEIIQDLTRVINTERKRKITQQMQELAAGAGLLDNK